MIYLKLSSCLGVSLRNEKLNTFINQTYNAGFTTNVTSDTLPPGLNEEVIRIISAKKQEPEFLLAWRLQAFRHWQTMTEPHWANINYKPLDYQAISYYSAPHTKINPKNLDEIDPEILATYKKLGIPLHEQQRLQGVAVDAVFDSISVATTFKEKLREYGVIFCSFSEAVQSHPELIQKYLGTVVPYTDNFFACLNSAVFTDGSFCYIPRGVKCPMELSTYFRINAQSTGQFERTLIIAEDDSCVSYLEGCTAPQRSENQLHAAVVELIALNNASILYSTIQNWYPGNAEGIGGIYNFVTKRALALGKNAKISWTQIETGSAKTWKYPSVILRGDSSVGEFYSITIANHKQQADTGTKMIHMAPNTKSTIIAKGISALAGENTYRGLVKMTPKATNARNYTQCDSLLLNTHAKAHTLPTIESHNITADAAHEATTTKINADQLYYCAQRGIDPEHSISLIVNGFCKDIIRKLPLEFAVEAAKLLEVSLEGATG